MSEELDLSTEEEVATPEVTEDHAPTMDETIANTLKEIEARNGQSDEDTPVERTRDDKGRFAAKDAAPQETPQEEAPAVEPSPVTEPAEAAPTVPPELQRLGLRKEEAEAIAANPVALQAFMRRSEEMHKGLEQYKTQAQFGQAMGQAIQPYMATIQTLGVHPAVAVQKLMSADHSLRYGTPQQKIEMIQRIAQDYGVDMGQVQEYQANQPYVDPQVQQLQGQLSQMQNWIQQQNQAREWQERQTLNSQIASFAQDPANTYFEQVKNDMAGLLQAGLASDLKDAYDKAIYANPTIRSQVLAKQQADAVEKVKQEASQKAQAAKRAAAVNVPKRGIVQPSKAVGSMEDTIRETAQRLGMI